MIWDGAPIHRDQASKSCLRNGGSKFVHLKRPYAPVLNPDEGTWYRLKQLAMRSQGCSTLHHLRRQVSSVVIRLRRKTHVIRTFLAAAGLPADSLCKSLCASISRYRREAPLTAVATLCVQLASELLAPYVHRRRSIAGQKRACQLALVLCAYL